jgi:exopolysaccharide production protein ExoZ
MKPFFARRNFAFFSDIYESKLPASSHRILAMEGLRGVAVSLVFFVHFGALFREYLLSSPFLLRSIDYLALAGNCGVDLFFALSGYLIYGGVLSKPIEYREFMRRRIRRIYPTFLVVLAIYLALSQLSPTESKIPVGFTNGLVYIAENILLLPGLFPINPIMTVSWSLSYELFYYLLIPVMIGCFRMRKWQSKHRIFFFVTLTGIILISYPWFDHPRLTLFLAGIIVYEVITFQKVPKLNAFFVALSYLIILLILPAYKIATVRWIAGVPILLIGIPVLLYLSFQNGTSAQQIFSWKPVRWLGNISYSYYLLHGLALKVLLKILTVVIPGYLSPHLIFWVILPCAFLFTIVASTGLFMLIEKPYSLNNPSTRKRISPAFANLVHRILQ